MATSHVLQERLEEVLVLEILKGGGSNYLHLSVRSLYNHVLSCITTPPSPAALAASSNGNENNYNNNWTDNLPPVLEEDHSTMSASFSTQPAKSSSSGEGRSGVASPTSNLRRTATAHMEELLRTTTASDPMVEPLPPLHSATSETSSSPPPPPPLMDLSPQQQQQQPRPVLHPRSSSSEEMEILFHHPPNKGEEREESDVSSYSISAAAATSLMGQTAPAIPNVGPPPQQQQQQAASTTVTFNLHDDDDHHHRGPSPPPSRSPQTIPGSGRSNVPGIHPPPPRAPLRSRQKSVTPIWSSTTSSSGSSDCPVPATATQQQQTMGGGGSGPLPTCDGGDGTGGAHNNTSGVTYRERLGAYLHPRDMRKLVMPFSSSNEPDLIVRRHVMLLNFDPLRTIILRDRLLVLVPDGADSMLVDLERRVRGGNKELENVIFGTKDSTLADQQQEQQPLTIATVSLGGGESSSPASAKQQLINAKKMILDLVKKTANRITSGGSSGKPDKSRHGSGQDPNGGSGVGSSDGVSGEGGGGDRSSSHHSSTSSVPTAKESGLSTTTTSAGGGSSDVGDLPDLATTERHDDDNNNNNNFNNATDNDAFFEDENHAALQAAEEWADIAGAEWIKLPFELQCTDAVLQTVVELLSEDTLELEQATLRYIDEIINETGTYAKEDALTIIRAIKDSVRVMTARVKGFVQSMSTILDDYEDMALMNLSRLLTHPEVFIQPVPAEVLEEESDEVELILESFLQQGLSLVTVMDLIQGQISTAAELVDQKLDAARNKILLANTVITTIALCVDCGMVVSSMFGMNLTNHLEDSDHAFVKVTFWTLAGCVALFFTAMSLMYKTGAIPRWSNVSESGF